MCGAEEEKSGRSTSNLYVSFHLYLHFSRLDPLSQDCWRIGRDQDLAERN